MRSTTVLSAALAVAGTATAHFGLKYPEWRVDTLSEANEEIYSQWEYPCAGANTTTNRTAYPIGGGAIELELHHPWAYVWVNLGLGTNTTNFNISLTPDLYNISGKGDFCWPKLPIPVDVADGTNATIQVVTGGASGSALYNCADITFRKDAPEHTCTNSTQFNVTVIRNGVDVAASATSAGASGSSSTTPTVKPAGAGAIGVSLASLTTAAGLAVVFVLGF